MNKKYTITLVAILIILVGIYLLTTAQRGTGTIEKPENVEVSADSSEIADITLYLAADTVKIERKNGKWRLTEPVDAEADQNAIHRLVREISNAELDVKITKDTEKHAKYQVDEGSGKYIKVTKKDGDTIEYWVGKRGPGGMTYMRFKGDREVWLLDSRLSSAIRRRATEYRDKQILDFKSDEIQGVYVEAPEQTLYLEHNAEEDKWQYSESKTGQTEKPDSNKIKTYLKSIPRLRTISFIDDPDSASKVNFENPDFNAEIALKGGNIIKLRGVFASDNNRRYVVKLDEQKTPLYVYSASMLNRLARDREYMTKPAPPPPPPGQRMRGMPPGGGKPGAQGGQQQLSPEMRKKLMEAMRKQQMQGN